MSERDYLDNVPLRLTSKFYPQPRPQFKEIDIHIPIDALQDDYDFSLERSVIIEAQAWEEHRRQEEERKAAEAIKKAKEDEERRRIEEEQRILEEEQRRIDEENRRIEEEQRRFEEEQKRVEEEKRRSEAEQIKLEEEQKRLEKEKRRSEEEQKKLKEQRRVEDNRTRIEKEDFESDAANSTDNVEIISINRMEVLAAVIKDNSVSVPASQNYRSDTHVSKTNYANGGSLSQEEQRKLKEEQRRVEEERRQIEKDFETDTANPFDNVELNSINEMEVLAAVLKNNSVSVPVSQNLTIYRGETHVTNTNYVNGGPLPSSVYGNQAHGTQQSGCYPGVYKNPPNLYTPTHPVQQQHWNTNNFYNSGPPTAPEISGRINSTPSTDPTTQMTNQSNIPSSSANSFTKYYFPLLSSMADSRSLRDRQNPYCNNVNQGYTQMPLSGTNPVLGINSAQQNPYLNSSHSPIQHFPILGSLSHPPSHNNYWSDGTSIPSQSSYNVPNNPITNGPLANDPLLKSNNSHTPSSSDLSASSMPNGTQQHSSLR